MSSIHEKVSRLEEQRQHAADAAAQVDLPNDMAYELRHLNSALSLEKGSEAAALAERIGYRKGTAAALLNQGFGEMVQANYATAFQTLHRALGLFDELNDAAGKGHALYNIGVVYSRIGEYNAALEAFQQSLVIRQSLGDRKGEAALLNQLAYIFGQFGNKEKSEDYYARCLAMQRAIDDRAGVAATLMAIALQKQKKGQYREAETDYRESLSLRRALGETHGWLVSMYYFAELYLDQNKPEEAAHCLTEALEIAERQVPPFPANLCRLYAGLGKVAALTRDYPQAVRYLEQAMRQATENNLKYQLHDIHLALVEVYKQSDDYRNALASYENYHAAKEEIINLTASTKLKNIELFNQIEDERKKAEIHRLRNIELKNAYDQLEAAQAQLIEKEKMASLGELTAGIAHEIQNPLNFVNNFSEVSKELLGDMKTELENGNAEDAKDIAAGVIQNLEKILHHGKRADAIVKGMLQHARKSTGQKEPTDLNALCDEYLRLSYHGFRGRDKSFNAALHTDFDGRTGSIDVVPQDIGKVLLNLFNNAFYAVHEKKKRANGAFEPAVTVRTKRVNDTIEISVSDNGTGITKKNVDKIFQPFFTTKPTGEGTGLGLSLSYDIITKGHGGEIKVETKEGEGTAFIIKLPQNA